MLPSGSLNHVDLAPPGGDDVVLGREARHVVLLEGHAACRQVGHFALDVVDLPNALTGLGRAGVRRRIEEARGVVAELIRDTAATSRPVATLPRD